MSEHTPKILYADDDTEPVRLLLRLRFPPLLIGLVLGIGISFLTSQFEAVLKANVHVAFFIPFIVYLADAIGTQTQTIYARDLRSRHTKLRNYLFKESILGLLLGVVFGLISWIIVSFWLHDTPLALSVGLSVALGVGCAPVVSIIVTEWLKDLHEDPAVGSGPIATVLQDAISILIYGIVTSIILL
jgi:magnesium transporter